MRASQVCALSPSSGEVLWTTPRGTLSSVDGVAVLRGEGVVIISEFAVGLHVLRGDDGGPVSPPFALQGASFLAVDRSTNTLFASANGAVVALAWSGAALKVLRSITSLGKQASRPMVVVPGATAMGGARLVVGNYSSSRIDVLSLPRLRPVAAYRLPRGTKVTGLAADARGTAIVVMNAGSKNGDVFPWPLPIEWTAATATDPDNRGGDNDGPGSIAAVSEPSMGGKADETEDVAGGLAADADTVV
jgi:hypothetical protein